MLNLKSFYKPKNTTESILTTYTTKNSTLNNLEVSLKMESTFPHELENSKEFGLNLENRCNISEIEFKKSNGLSLEDTEKFWGNSKLYYINNRFSSDINENVIAEAIYLIVKTGDFKSMIDIYRLGNEKVKHIILKTVESIFEEYNDLNQELFQYKDNTLDIDIMDGYSYQNSAIYKSFQTFVNKTYNVELDQEGKVYRCYRNAYGPGFFQGIYGWLKKEEDCSYYPIYNKLIKYAEFFIQSDKEIYKKLLYAISENSRYKEPFIAGGQTYCKKLNQLKNIINK